MMSVWEVGSPASGWDDVAGCLAAWFIGLAHIGDLKNTFIQFIIKLLKKISQ